MSVLLREKNEGCVGPHREIEGPSAANDIRANAPSGGANGKTNVLGEDQVDGSRGMQLVDDRRQDDGRHLRPELIETGGSAEFLSHACHIISSDACRDIISRMS